MSEADGLELTMPVATVGRYLVVPIITTGLASTKIEGEENTEKVCSHGGRVNVFRYSSGTTFLGILDCDGDDTKTRSASVTERIVKFNLITTTQPLHIPCHNQAQEHLVIPPPFPSRPPKSMPTQSQL